MPRYSNDPPGNKSEQVQLKMIVLTIAITLKGVPGEKISLIDNSGVANL